MTICYWKKCSSSTTKKITTTSSSSSSSRYNIECSKWCRTFQCIFVECFICLDWMSMSQISIYTNCCTSCISSEIKTATALTPSFSSDPIPRHLLHNCFITIFCMHLTRISRCYSLIVWLVPLCILRSVKATCNFIPVQFFYTHFHFVDCRFSLYFLTRIYYANSSHCFSLIWFYFVFARYFSDRINWYVCRAYTMRIFVAWNYFTCI